MNLSVQNVMRGLFILFLLSPALSRAQGINFKNIEQLVNTTTNEALEPGAHSISVAKAAKHGVVDIPSTGTISYTPSTGFVGKDTFVVNYFYINNSINYQSSRAYEVKVAPSIVKARPDYTHTAINQTILIDALSNDQTIGGGQLTLSGISLSNNGNAIIVNDQISFTPNSGFTGNAYINYSVCDDAGTCAAGSVSIVVRPSVQLANTNLALSTSKNTSVVVLLPNSNYTLATSAINGNIQALANNAWRYTPNNNYTGTDNAIFAENGKTVTVAIDVLNKNTVSAFAKDDYYYTPKNQTVAGNVLSNDYGYNMSPSLVTAPNANQGTVTFSSNGQFVFTPANNFKGIAKFTYNITISGVFANPVNENADVYVNVSNQNPGKPLFELTTPKNTPLVLNYSIPFSGFNFSVTDPAENGSVIPYSGSTSINLGNTTVSGQSLVVYTPSNNFVGNDEFELLYCINNECKPVKIKVKVENITPNLPSYCVGDCVWSGDANNDGVVDMNDLLLIGYCMGENGASRPNASMNWFGQDAQNWFNPFIPLAAPNLKYMDTDGDGTITNTDTIALSAHYGFTHNIVPEKTNNLKQFPLWFKVLTPNPQIGDLVEIEVNLGKAATPVTDMSGFTFSLNYNTQVVHPGSLQLNYDSQSWLAYNAPTLNMLKIPYEGKADMGYTRTSGTTASGFGKIGKLSIVIDDIIGGIASDNGNYYAVFTVNAANMIDAKGTAFAVAGEDFIVPIKINKQKKALTENSLRVYPNPAVDKVNVHLNDGHTMEEFCVYNVNGQQVHFSGNLDNNSATLDVSNYVPGVYMIQAVTKDGVVTKKFVKE